MNSFQRVAVARRVNLGVYDRIADAFEKTADAREQVFLVAHVNHDLQAFAGGGQAGLDHRHRRIDAIVEQPRVPRDFFDVVAQKV